MSDEHSATQDCTASVPTNSSVVLSTGDLDSRFRALVDEHQDAAIRTARRLLGGDCAAEDVAQEAFLRAFKGLPKFRGEASLRTWFFRILVREVQRHKRWQVLRKIWSTDSTSEMDLPAIERPAGDSALRSRIVTALDGLPQRQREAFVLVHLEQFTVKEAAEILGVSLGTAKVHVHRATKALRVSLGDLRESETTDSGGIS